jgi:hypothetical protein
VFNSVSVGGGETAAAVGQIDQDTHTIEVRVPYSATITNLAPTITYLGSSLEYSDTSPGTPSQIDTNTGPAGQSDTFTDAPRDFSADRYYTVTAVDTTTTITQEYTVKVVKMPEITIRYEGVRDEEFITENFDEGTGLLTIKVTGTNYGAPHEWYVDGVKQPVSDTQDILELKTADFEPGTHQVTVSAKGPDNKHYTNLVYFLVQE